MSETRYDVHQSVALRYPLNRSAARRPGPPPRLFGVAATLAMVLCLSVATPSSVNAECVLVTNYLGGSVVVIDPTRKAVAQTISFPRPPNYCLAEPGTDRVRPSGIAVQADGSRAYIATGACALYSIIWPDAR